MTKESSLKPFEEGDVFVGATVLNNDKDDHAGDGRIIQYDSDLNEKGVLWTERTTHLVSGLKFGPDGTLWAFDSCAFNVLRISPEGHQLPEIKFADRSFSNINFLPDGSICLGEHLVGEEYQAPPDRPLGTYLPFMPGTELYGNGHVFRFTQEGELIKEYTTESHGGMPGFLGVTSSTLAPDGKTLVYCSELGTRLFRYDLDAGAQLPDMITYPPETGYMAMTCAYQPDGTLLYIKANFREGFFLETLDGEGSATRKYDTAGPGWAALGPSIDSKTAFVGNFFTGAIIKLDLESGETVAQTDTGVQRALAGIAQYPG
jgi:outer membrane protein assembly factor BamB